MQAYSPGGIPCSTNPVAFCLFPIHPANFPDFKAVLQGLRGLFDKAKLLIYLDHVAPAQVSDESCFLEKATCLYFMLPVTCSNMFTLMQTLVCSKPDL